MKKLKQQSNVLLLRMLFLLAMVLTGSSASWAWQGNSTVTLTSNTSANAELAAYTLSGINENDVVQALVNGVNQNFYKFGSDAAFVRIEFINGSDHHKFMPGDELTVTMLSTATGKAGFRLKNTSNANVEIDATANTAIEVKRTLTADDIDDDGKLTIYRANGVGYACRYYKFAVKCVRYGTDIFVSSNDVTKGTAKLQVTYVQDGETNVPLNTDAVAVSVKSGANVQFTATPADGKLFWYWKKNGVVSYDNTNPLKVYGITENLDYQAVFTDGVKHYVYTNDANIGTVKITRDGNGSFTQLHVNPGTPGINFVATEVVANSFKGWYTDADRKNPAPAGDGCTYTDKTYKLTGDQLNNGLTLFAKFEAAVFNVTANYTPDIPANAVGWGLADVTVKVNGATIDASKYTLKYEVVDGNITLNGKNATVTSANENKDETAHVKVTAIPNAGTDYVAGSTTFDVRIWKIAGLGVDVTPQVARIGEKITLYASRKYTGFSNPTYDWSFSNGAGDYLYGTTTGEIKGGEETHRTLYYTAKAATSSPINVHVKFKSDAGWSNHTTNGEEANGTITVRPVAVPAITEDIDGVHFTFESDYTGVNGTVDAWLEYYYYNEGGNKITVTKDQGVNTLNGKCTVTDLPQGTRIYAKSEIYYKDADNGDNWVSSAEIQFVTDDGAPLPEFVKIKQPRWKEGIAKQYIPIGKIKVIGGDNDGKELTSLWPSGVNHGSGAVNGATVGYILGGNEYPFDAEKGICISRHGKAHWGWSSNASDKKWQPKSAAFFMEVAGTMDIVLYAENEFHGSQNTTDGNEANRRYIKVKYWNDQCKTGEPIELASWGIVGNRSEGNTTGGNELRLHIRLPQLGTDGVARLFFTYEGDNEGRDVNDTEHNLWIKGFMVQRPDLTQSIGRTDNRYTDGNRLTNICVTEPNTPYVWSFEPTSKNHKNENIHGDGKDAIGFRPTVDTNEKKANIYDGRTYICGDKCDHLLVYCDNQDQPSEANDGSRPEFDGRVGDNRDGNAHLELVRPTVMAGNNGNDDKFNPIKSNGIKVNVTGSGWFKVKAAAPNCDVKMKVLTSTNGGNSKIRVLKEFLVPQTSEMGWNEYTAYLKAQVNDYGTYDELDATGDPEAKLMSFYVVFEAADGVALAADGKVNGTSDYPQLNINQMSWLNETPMDYVFQREENPKLLTELQTIKRDGKTVLRWQAGNPNINEALNNVEVATFDINDQKDTKTGPTSFSGKVTNGNSAGYVWNIAAKPAVGSHTEAAQRYTDKYHYTDGTNGTKDTRFVPGNETTEMEFGLPISGSFYRLYPEKNGHVIAYIVPSAANKKVYVLDETGARVDYLDNESNYANLSQAQKARGGVKTVTGGNQNEKAYTSATVDGGISSIRLDIYVSAGKEYFICGDDAISLAALHWYQTREGDATAATLNNDGSGNSDVITKAQSAQNVGSYTGTMYTDIALNREFNANQWASLVLPFSMNELKFKEVFGDNAICIHFTSVDPATNTVNLTHHYYNMIVAGRPVFVRPSKSFTTADIYDVTLQAGEVIPTVANGITFTGNIDNGTIPENSLFMSGNAIKHTTVEKQNVGAMRVWIEGGDVLTDIANKTTGAPVARLLNYDGTLLDGDIATGIESALAEVGMDAAVINASTVIYNLQGNKVATGAEMQNLPAGVYVVKGKKFIVK